MAIYHLHVQIISRKNGRSAVACAAFRSGDRLRDERYGEVRNYARNNGFLAKRTRQSYILSPDGSPEWTRSLSDFGGRRAGGAA